MALSAPMTDDRHLLSFCVISFPVFASVCLSVSLSDSGRTSGALGWRKGVVRSCLLSELLHRGGCWAIGPLPRLHPNLSTGDMAPTACDTDVPTPTPRTAHPTPYPTPHPTPHLTPHLTPHHTTHPMSLTPVPKPLPGLPP
jgi:hypothetical protein